MTPDFTGMGPRAELEALKREVKRRESVTTGLVDYSRWDMELMQMDRRIAELDIMLGLRSR